MDVSKPCTETLNLDVLCLFYLGSKDAKQLLGLLGSNGLSLQQRSPVNRASEIK